MNVKENIIRYRMRLFEQYCKGLITLEEYTKRMSEVNIDEE
jgi:hypothetical protein